MSRDFEWKDGPNSLFGDLLALGMKRLDGQQVLSGFIFMLAHKGRDFLDCDFDQETGEGQDADDEHLLEVFRDNEFTFLFEEDGNTLDLLIPGQFTHCENCRNKRKALAAELRIIIFMNS